MLRMIARHLERCFFVAFRQSEFDFWISTTEDICDNTQNDFNRNMLTASDTYDVEQMRK